MAVYVRASVCCDRTPIDALAAAGARRRLDHRPGPGCTRRRVLSGWRHRPQRIDAGQPVSSPGFGAVPVEEATGWTVDWNQRVAHDYLGALLDGLRPSMLVEVRRPRGPLQHAPATPSTQADATDATTSPTPHRLAATNSDPATRPTRRTHPRIRPSSMTDGFAHPDTIVNGCRKRARRAKVARRCLPVSSSRATAASRPFQQTTRQQNGSARAVHSTRS
jgi:hypothetical protein